MLHHEWFTSPASVANARVLRIEDIDQLQAGLDGAISDFGAFNCVEHVNRGATSAGRELG